jgi:hypothetical protein
VPRPALGLRREVRDLFALQQALPAEHVDGHVSMLASPYRGARSG